MAMNEFRSVMPFPKTQVGNRPRSNGAVSRVMPEIFSGILNRQAMLNYASCRSLSPQRAFMQGGKHRPDPTPEKGGDKCKSQSFIFLQKCLGFANEYGLSKKRFLFFYSRLEKRVHVCYYKELRGRKPLCNEVKTHEKHE